MSDNLPSHIKLVVVTSHHLLVDEEVGEVSLPSLDGNLGILPGHRNLLLALGKGTLVYKRGQDENKLDIEGGYAKVHPDRVHVFTELRRHETEPTDKG
jgi:F-type H+-transporting ATPase subunit epsilon